MLLQNTVDPWSNLLRDKERISVFMGNRGVLHDRTREVRKPWLGQRWLCCARTFGGIDRRPLFKTDPFSYSELFFLDEATAYAAGHRPCNDCRRPDLEIFKKFWGEADPAGSSSTPIRVSDIDSQLHQQRVGADGKKLTYRASLQSLPAGAMVSRDGTAYLVGSRGIRRWTVSGYLDAALRADMEVDVLTPRSIVILLARGLPVQVHESADAQSRWTTRSSTRLLAHWPVALNPEKSASLRLELNLRRPRSIGDL